MPPCRRRGHPPARSAHEHPQAHEERLRDGLDGLRLLAHRDGERREAHRTATEPAHERIEHRLVDAIEAEGIDLVQLEGGPGARATHHPVAVDLGPVAHAPQEPVGDPRGPAAAARDLGHTLGVDRDREQAGRAVDDDLEVARVVEVQVRREAEPVAQRAGQQAGPRGGADEGERLDVERNGGGARTLADHDIDAEVLHRQVQELLRGARGAMDLVDEQHLAGLEAGEHRRHVACVLQRRTRGHAQGGAHLGGDDAGEGGLPEAGRSAQEDVVCRAAAPPRRLEDQPELRLHPVLPDELGQGGGAQGSLDDRVVGVRLGAHRPVAAHGAPVPGEVARVTTGPACGGPP